MKGGGGDKVLMNGRIHYRIATDLTLDMASPRGFEPLLPA